MAKAAIVSGALLVPLAGRSGRAGLRQPLHAEWTKLRTLPGTFWLLAAAAALTIVVGAAAASAFSCPDAASCSAAVTQADPAKISLTGLDLGQVLVAVLAVLAVGGEYGTGMIRVTFTAIPRRLVVLAAKAAVVTGLALAVSVVAVLGSALAGRLLLPARGMTAANGYVVLSLGNGPDLRAVAGSVLYLLLIALLALGVATAVRDSGVAIGIVLGLLFLFPILTAVIPDRALARHLEQASPMTAGQYIEATVGVKSLPLTPWQGLGVLALWTLGALLLGAVVLRSRDALGTRREDDDEVAVGTFAGGVGDVVDELPVDGHRGGAAAVEVHRVNGAQRLHQRGLFAERRALAHARLAAVHRDQDEPALPVDAGDRARLPGLRPGVVEGEVGRVDHTLGGGVDRGAAVLHQDRCGAGDAQVRGQAEGVASGIRDPFGHKKAVPGDRVRRKPRRGGAHPLNDGSPGGDVSAGLGADGQHGAVRREDGLGAGAARRGRAELAGEQHQL
jgi:ABC-2 type transport system permease protein